jgi:hypothetical protein
MKFSLSKVIMALITEITIKSPNKAKPFLLIIIVKPFNTFIHYKTLKIIVKYKLSIRYIRYPYMRVSIIGFLIS